MPTYDPRIEEAMRQGSKYLNRFIVLLWRLELGRWINAWPEVGGRIMVLTHFGRKSGRRYRTPLGYAIQPHVAHVNFTYYGAGTRSRMA